MRRIPFILLGMLFASAPALAQDQPKYSPEIRPIVGAMVPIGSQFSIYHGGILAGAQVAMETPFFVHLVGTATWSPTRLKATSFENRVTMYNYDVGGEAFANLPLMARPWALRPFAGLGIGARTLHMVDMGLDSQTSLTGYGALGLEVQNGAFAGRVEARDYGVAFKGYAGNEKANIRSNIAIFSGLAYHLW